MIMTMVFIVLLFILMNNLKSFMLSLVVLEMMSFFTLAVISCAMVKVLCGYIYLTLFFVFFVIEGALGLLGLVIMVSMSGKDYLTLSLLSGF